MPSLHDTPFPDGLPLTFPRGLPGFDTATRFVLREAESLAPVKFLQSVDSENLCFLVVPVALVMSDYSLALTCEDLDLLGIDLGTQTTMPEILGLAILTAPEGGPLTANLLAPLAINLAAGTGVQAVRSDSVYSHRHVVATLPAAAEVGTRC